MPIIKHTQRLKFRYVGGFTIVELLVSMLISMTIMAGVVQVFFSSTHSFNTTDIVSRLQENGRIGTEMLATDIRRAGYLGRNSDVDTIAGTLGKLTPDNTCVLGDTTWGQMIEQRIYGLDDDNTGYACIPASDYLRGDILTIRYASPWFVDEGDLIANKDYLRSSMFEGKIFLGADEDDDDNEVMDEPQTIHELVARSYYVRDTGRSCNGAAIPGLYRVALDNDGLPVAVELLPGVENFQVQYLANGQYFDADNVADWDAVTGVQFNLLVRAQCAETGFTDSRTYTIGDQIYTPADSFRRQVYKRVVALRN